MKNYIDFLLEEILLEDVSRTKFRFGFELEGYVKDGSELDKMLFEGIEKLDNYGRILESSRIYAYEKLQDFFMKDLLSGGFKEEELIRQKTSQKRIEESVHDDPTLEHDWKHLSFEFSSPVFPHTTEWIRHIISCLQKWIGSGYIFTDNKCGFHNHISYEGMTERDSLWIYANLCKRYDYVSEHFSSLKEKYGPELTTIVDGKEHKFLGEWASYTFIKNSRRFLLRNELQKFLKYAFYNKLSVFHLHPHGTIEWRGPRNFMNTSPDDNAHIDVDVYKRGDNTPEKKLERRNKNANVQQPLRNIQQFYTMMAELIRFIIKCEMQKTIVVGGIDNIPEETLTKEEFLSNAWKNSNNNNANTDNETENNSEKEQEEEGEKLKKLLNKHFTTTTGKYTITPDKEADEIKYTLEDIKNLYVQGYNFSGEGYALQCKKESPINFNECSFYYKNILFLDNVKLYECSFSTYSDEEQSNIIWKNSTFSFCDLTYISTYSSIARRHNINVKNCTFEQYSHVNITLVADNNNKFRNDEFIGNTFNVIISFFCEKEHNIAACCEYIHNFYKKNTIKQEIKIYFMYNRKTKTIRYSQNDMNNNWIGNDEKYNSLMEQIEKNSSFSFIELKDL